MTVGRITGVFGVKGWVRVYSYTSPRENILRYAPWFIGEVDAVPYALAGGGVHGRGIVAHLEGVDDRDVARRLIGATISVPRESLSELAAGEYYWSDLMGLSVVDQQGRDLGRVAELIETGANDVLVLNGERRRLVPFVPGSVVKSVDLAAGLISVDWDSEF